MSNDDTDLRVCTTKGLIALSMAAKHRGVKCIAKEVRERLDPQGTHVLRRESVTNNILRVGVFASTIDPETGKVEPEWISLDMEPAMFERLTTVAEELDSRMQANS